MKTKVIFVSVVVFSTLFISFSTLQKERSVSETLQLMNIEALANNEFYEPICVGSGSVDCPTNHVKVLYYQ